jgi:hypothetical protein
MSIGIPFYDETRFRIYFSQYTDISCNSDYYFLNSNDLVDELYEKIAELGYSVDLSLDMDPEEYCGDAEPNTINVLLNGHITVKIIGHKDNLGPRFIVSTTLTDPRKKKLINLLKSVAGISENNIQKRANKYNRRRELLPKIAVQKQLPTGVTGIINSFLGQKGKVLPNLGYPFTKNKNKKPVGGTRKRRRNHHNHRRHTRHN